ncbi:uncharacterized protein LTR77_008134 [Saxophila tyrrhenica]|uniref:BTB domain-containing protein n=1 Tax=Saxophila tyrrhenica TaxID=1690608 RepID=A0AAV9P2D7_9PEZI|nr:hypothetical protein LTR77_008134 [Saxophila tyrrhenica]
MGEASELTKRFKDYDDLVTIKLEGIEDVHIVQKAILCAASPYFLKALDGGFSESSKLSLTLPGCDTGTFEVFLYWLCHRKVPEEVSNPPAEDVIPDAKVSQLFRLWTFDDAYLMPRLQNEAMHCFFRTLELMVDIAKLQRVSEERVPRSPSHTYYMDDWMVLED